MGAARADKIGRTARVLQHTLVRESHAEAATAKPRGPRVMSGIQPSVEEVTVRRFTRRSAWVSATIVFGCTETGAVAPAPAAFTSYRIAVEAGRPRCNGAPAHILYLTWDSGEGCAGTC